MLTDDRQLLLRTRDGHEPAARLLWDRHAPRLISYARSVLPPGLAPEDTVQAVFCRVVALDRSTIKSVQDVAAWLTSLVRREALNAMRSARREKGRVERVGAAMRPAGPAQASPPLSGGESHESLHRALDALPRRLREVVTLKHVSGLTFDQIAQALSVPRGTAATRYRMAIDTLRRALVGPVGALGRKSAPMEVLHG